MTELYASENGRVAQLSPTEVLFHNAHAVSNHVMTLQVLSALDQCRAFRTMDEHIASVVERVNGLQGQHDGVRQVLNAMIERKLLVKASDAFGELGAAQSTNVAPLAGIFVRTCDRPEQLDHLLATLPTGSPRVIVLDDSRNPASTDRNRELVAETNGRGVESYLIDAQLRADIGAALVAETRAPAAMVEWLLHGQEDAALFSGGRVYNLALLLGAGQRIAMVDDDFRFEVRDYGAMDAPLELRDAQPAVRFHDTYSGAQSVGDAVGPEPLFKAMESCGSTLGDLIAGNKLAAPVAGDWAGRPLAALRNFSARTRVISVLPASYGDDRTGNREWLYTLDEQGRRSLWGENQEDYQRHLENRHIVYAMERPTLRSMANFTPLVLDNSQMLAPAAPLHRGEDLYQSALSRFCHPDTVCLEVPLAMGHWREGKRRMAPPAARSPGIARFIADTVLGTSGCVAHAPRDRLAYAGRILRDLAAATNEARQERLVQYLTSVRADTVNHLNQVLDQVKEAPDYWANDVRTLLEANALAVTNPGPPKLAEWRTEATAEACADRLSRDLVQHAEGLDVWPTLWSQCDGRLDEWLALA